MKINSFLSPSYWGSWLAFIIILLASTVIALVSGPPNYIISFDLNPSESIVEFYCTLIIVLIYLIRHYSAVAVQLYGGHDDSIYDLPGWLRAFTFVALVLLIILASVNSFIVASIGIQIALIVCIAQSILSLLSFFVFAISKLFQPELFRDVSPQFKWNELLFLPFIIVLLLLVLGVIGTNPEYKGLEWGLTTALISFFFMHEWRKTYKPIIYEQLRRLREELLSSKVVESNASGES